MQANGGLRAPAMREDVPSEVLEHWELEMLALWAESKEGESVLHRVHGVLDNGGGGDGGGAGEQTGGVVLVAPAPVLGAHRGGAGSGDGQEVFGDDKWIFVI